MEAEPREEAITATAESLVRLKLVGWAIHPRIQSITNDIVTLAPIIRTCRKFESPQGLGPKNLRMQLIRLIRFRRLRRWNRLAKVPPLRRWVYRVRCEAAAPWPATRLL